MRRASHGIIDSRNAWRPANPRHVRPVNYTRVPLSAVEASDFTVGALFRERAEAYEDLRRGAAKVPSPDPPEDVVRESETRAYTRACGTTAHAGEAVLEDAAGEILLDHLGDDRPPVSVTVGEPLIVDRTDGCSSATTRCTTTRAYRLRTNRAGRHRLEISDQRSIAVASRAAPRG